MVIEEEGEENCQKLDPASFSSLVQKEKEDFPSLVQKEKEVVNRREEKEMEEEN